MIYLTETNLQGGGQSQCLPLGHQACHWSPSSTGSWRCTHFKWRWRCMHFKWPWRCTHFKWPWRCTHFKWPCRSIDWSITTGASNLSLEPSIDWSIKSTTGASSLSLEPFINWSMEVHTFQMALEVHAFQMALEVHTFQMAL
jgi:hypothetical protein